MAQGGGGGGGRPQALRRVTEPMAGNDTKSETERSDYWIEMKRSLQREDGDDLIPEDTERFGGSPCGPLRFRGKTAVCQHT